MMTQSNTRVEIEPVQTLQGRFAGENLRTVVLDDPIPSQPTSLHSEWDTNEGWPAVAAGSAIFFTYLGLVYSYGIVQLHLTEARLASVSTLSFIGSVGAAMSPLTGMIVARIIKRIGYRATAFFGSLFHGLGEFAAGWSTKSGRWQDAALCKQASGRQCECTRFGQPRCLSLQYKVPCMQPTGSWQVGDTSRKGGE